MVSVCTTGTKLARHLRGFYVDYCRGRVKLGMFPQTESRGAVMHLTAAHISPIVALIAGILILLVPRLLNYVVAIYLIVVGIVGLNGIYHWMK
jgi:Protein of unknown function (DUF3096)